MSHNEFPMIEATRKSLSMRKTIHGIGINDSWYITNLIVNGTKLSCTYYNTWKHMIGRVYDPKYNRRKAYEGTSVCDEWLVFSSFRKWMKEQPYKDNHLDKDILFPNNKVYSPDTCVFVSPALNSLLTDSKNTRGKYPIGVNLNKQMNKYNANIRRHNILYFLGYYDTPAEAHAVYLQAKIDYINTFIDTVEPKIAEGLNKHIAIMLNIIKDYHET